MKQKEIGLIGHSMGGWASVVAAAAHPDFYRSIVLVNSSTSTPPYEPIPGSSTFPKNVMVLEARYSEFSQLMWGLPIAPGKLYGSIPDGTAREFESVPTTHPFLTLGGKAVALAVGWMQHTLAGVSPMPPTHQIWPWDEIGTFIALIGVILVPFPVGALLPASSLFAQTITIGIMGWAVGGGVIGLILLLLWHFVVNRRVGEASRPMDSPDPTEGSSGRGSGSRCFSRWLCWPPPTSSPSCSTSSCSRSFSTASCGGLV